MHLQYPATADSILGGNRVFMQVIIHFQGHGLDPIEQHLMHYDAPGDGPAILVKEGFLLLNH